MDGPEILIPLVAILVGGIAIILPIAGLTARFALKPLVDSYVRVREGGGGERMELMARRLTLLEEQLQAVEKEQARLAEDQDFRAQLKAGPR